MNKAYLLIGGNMGNRLALLEQARTAIEHYCGPILRHSGIYETAAWGKTDQPSFLNQVLLVQTAYDAEELLRRMLAIEKEMGRMRLEKYGPRLMDIDILLFNADIINLPGLQVPHPRMTERRFVLVPLAEIAFAFVHPEFGVTINELLLQCRDELEVHKL